MHTRFSDGRSAITRRKGHRGFRKLFAPLRFGARPFFDRLTISSARPVDSNLEYEMTAGLEPFGRETALEAGQFAKRKAKGDIIELRDFAIGDARDAGIWRGGLAPSGV